MKIGDYVRTKSNGIQKIDEEGRINLGLIRPPFRIIKEEELLKSSPNIIDLIEVGDYVNGSKVQEIGEGYVEIEEYSGLNNDMPCVVKVEDIKSIVTKEQFSQMEYKVGD